jgi:hypothetical protein
MFASGNIARYFTFTVCSFIVLMYIRFVVLQNGKSETLTKWSTWSSWTKCDKSSKYQYQYNPKENPMRCYGNSQEKKVCITDELEKAEQSFLIWFGIPLYLIVVSIYLIAHLCKYFTGSSLVCAILRSPNRTKPVCG